MEVALPSGLAKGVYTVGWVIRSNDTDIVSGSYQFTLTAGEADDGATSTWLLVARAVMVLALVGILLSLRRRSRVGVIIGVLLRVAGGLITVSLADHQ